MAQRGPFLVAATLAVGVLLTAPAAAAAEDETDHPVLVTAEELIHDEKNLDDNRPRQGRTGPWRAHFACR